MKCTFTTGITTVTLADPTDAWGRALVMEQMPLKTLVDVVALYGALLEGIYPRGNASGQCVFTVDGRYDSYDTMATQVKAALALANAQGTLILIPAASSTVTWTMPNAVLREVAPSFFNGYQIKLRYTFDINEVI